MKIAVIGAGIAGLSVATYLSRRQHDVTVFEAGDRIGGRAITLGRKDNNDCVDAGTQYYHSNYRRALRLIHDSGLGGQLSKVRGYTRIFDDFHSNRSFLLHRRFPWYGTAGIAGNIGLGSYLLMRLLEGSSDPFTDRYSKEIDLRSGCPVNGSSLAFRAIVKPLSLAGSLCEPEEMRISMHHVNRIVRVILFTSYLSLDRGTASLHERLADSLRVRMEHTVLGLNLNGNRVDGVFLAPDQRMERADHVFIATTPTVAANIIPGAWVDERNFLNSIKIPEFILPTYFLDRPLQDNVWSYLVAGRSSSGLISFITDGAQKNPHMVPSGKSAIQPWICYPESKNIIGLSKHEMIDRCTQELEQLFPGFSNWIEDIYITRHAYAVPFTPTGHQYATRHFLESADRRSGVSFCGDYLTGGYMESAIWSAERAVQRIMKS